MQELSLLEGNNLNQTESLNLNLIFFFLNKLWIISTYMLQIGCIRFVASTADFAI